MQEVVPLSGRHRAQHLEALTAAEQPLRPPRPLQPADAVRSGGRSWRDPRSRSSLKTNMTHVLLRSADAVKRPRTGDSSATAQLANRFRPLHAIPAGTPRIGPIRVSHLVPMGPSGRRSAAAGGSSPGAGRLPRPPSSGASCSPRRSDPQVKLGIRMSCVHSHQSFGACEA